MIITIEEEKVIEIPGQVYDHFKLMQKKECKEDCLNKFLLVGDIWDFDNIGVSKDIPATITEVTGKKEVSTPKYTSQTFQFEADDAKWRISKCVKYLICADCDKGPIGMVCEVTNTENETATKTLNFLSLNSVKQL